MPVKKLIVLDEDVFKKIRKIQFQKIVKHKESVSVSDIVNQVLIGKLLQNELTEIKCEKNI